MSKYSDLEFGYITERKNDNEYFVKLAMTMYFTLNNFGETPLKGFYIEEPIDNYCQENEERWFKDTTTSGFKFDGITPSSGSVPTGNGQPGGRPLTFTVDCLYRDSPESIEGNKPEGNISYFFASIICLYSSYGTESLHKRFILKRRAYEEGIASIDPIVRQHRLDILQDDVIKYKFVPDFEAEHDSETAEVKPDVFRWPTLLGQNVNINLHSRRLRCTDSWSLWVLTPARQTSRRPGKYISYQG